MYYITCTHVNVYIYNTHTHKGDHHVTFDAVSTPSQIKRKAEGALAGRAVKGYTGLYMVYYKGKLLLGSSRVIYYVCLCVYIYIHIRMCMYVHIHIFIYI